MKIFSLIVCAYQSFMIAANPLDFKHVGLPSPGPVSSSPPDYRNDVVMFQYEAGGLHGDDYFDDKKFIGQVHNRIGQIHMWCDAPNGEMQAISFKYRDNLNAKNNPDAVSGGDVHGTNQNPKWEHVWKLDLDEYIRTIDVWTYKARGHTRIGSMVFTSNKRNKFASCGPKTGRMTTFGGDGQALSYVSGTSGRVVDYIKAYFIASRAF